MGRSVKEKNRRGEKKEKIINFISELPIKYPYIIIPAVFILTFLSLWGMRNLQIKLSFFDELPPDHPQVKRFKYVAENYGGTDFIFIAIEGENLSEMKMCAAKIEDELKKMPEIKSVRGKIDIDFFKKHALFYLEEKRLNELVDLMKRRKDEIVQLFLNLGFPEFVSAWSDLISKEILERENLNEDEIDEFVKSISNIRNWVAEISKAILEGKVDKEKYKSSFEKAFLMMGDIKREDYSINQDYLISQDMSTILISAFPTRPADDYGFNKIIYDKIMNMKERVSEGPCKNTKLHIGGNYIGLEEQRRIALQDMSKTGTISYILTILIFLLAFRGIVGGIIMTAYLAIGIFLTFGVLMLSFGYVTIISALFGSILIGMGIDYGAYVFSRWREEATHQDDKIFALKKSIKEVIPPTFEAAITTSAGFLCIYISQIKGAKILAFVSACGILIYLLLSWVFLPAIIKYFSKSLMKTKIWDFVDKIFYKTSDLIIPNSKLILLVFTPIIFLVIILGIRDFGFEYNLRKILPRLEAIKAEDFIVEKFGRSKDYTVMLAKDLEELKEKIQKIKRTKTFGKVESIMIFYPEDIDKKLDYVKQIDKVVSDIYPGAIPGYGIFPATYIKSSFEKMQDVAEAMIQLAVLSGTFEGEDEAKKLKEDIQKLVKELDKLGDKIDISSLQKINADVAMEFLEDLKKAAKSRGFNIEDLPQDIKNQFIGKDKSFIIFAYPKRPIWENELYMKENLKEALSIDKEAFGVSALFISVTERAKKDLLNSLILALIVQLIVLSIAFRRPLLVGLAMSPVITATLFTASFCPMIGIKAHYINVAAFAIIVGLSEDYGVNMIYRLFSEKNVKKVIEGTGRAILVAALTTILGFLSLIFANFPGLRHFGLMIAIGNLVALIVSVVILPSLLNIFKEKILKG
jgi:predicted RND superfamily exporter protein